MSTTAIFPHVDLRHPYWLSRTDRSDLAEAVLTLQRAVALFPSTKAALEAVVVELGVAEARDRMWPERAGLARAVHGYPQDHLPVRMSDTERDAVLGVTLISDSVRNRLSTPNTGQE